jgi:hypothetical protein
MIYAILHSLNVRDSFCFDAEDNDIFGPEHVRAAIRVYMQNPQRPQGTYALAGVLEADDLEDAFCRSQNEDADWRERGERSTSVGDVLIPLTDEYDYTGDAFCVERFGFCQLVGATTKGAA